MKRVLVLGAGLVSGPLLARLLTRAEYRLTVASLDLGRAESLLAGHARATLVRADVLDPQVLEPLIGAADLVVSLVPPAHHALVAALAVRHRTPLVTTSYVSPAMRALDAEARQAGVILLNEVGLDPGLDHMSAMRIIDRAHAEGARVTGFISACGSLPAPEAADNPWGYRFAWNPRGALAAGLNPARFLLDGRLVEVPAPEAFTRCWPYAIAGLGAFEIYPNRDALAYRDAYGLDEARTLLRATLRYPGWCATMRAVARLGLLEADERAWPPGTTYRDVLGHVTGRESADLASALELPAEHPVLERLAWAGLAGTERIPPGTHSPLDLLTAALEPRLAYAPGQRDMVVMRHEILVESDRAPAELRVAELIDFGAPDDTSATARTVGLPAALAAELVLEGQICTPGVQIPTRPEIYEPLLARLAGVGIAFHERRETPPARWPHLG